MKFFRNSLLSALLVLLAAIFSQCSSKPSDDKVDVQEHIQDLKSSDPKLRAAAAFALGDAQENFDEVVPALSEALTDGSKEVRKAAALSLMELGPDARSAVPQLKEAYRSESDNDVALSIGNAIREIAPSEAQKMELPYY
jgi:HEAT repeat protein